MLAACPLCASVRIPALAGYERAHLRKCRDCGFVFAGPKAPLWQEALRFFPSVLLFRALEVALFSLLHAAWRNYHVAYFATAAISMLVKLLWSKWFIFRRPSP